MNGNGRNGRREWTWQSPSPPRRRRVTAPPSAAKYGHVNDCTTGSVQRQHVGAKRPVFCFGTVENGTSITQKHSTAPPADPTSQRHKDYSTCQPVDISHTATSDRPEHGQQAMRPSGKNGRMDRQTLPLGQEQVSIQCSALRSMPGSEGGLRRPDQNGPGQHHSIGLDGGPMALARARDSRPPSSKCAAAQSAEKTPYDKMGTQPHGHRRKRGRRRSRQRTLGDAGARGEVGGDQEVDSTAEDSRKGLVPMCVIIYYPAACGPKAHGSSSAAAEVAAVGFSI